MSVIDTTTSIANLDLAPSELACLNGPRFAPKKGGPTDSAPHLPGSKLEDYSQLAVRVVALALLADEAVGSIRLEAGTQKKLFGLRTVQVVNATATDQAPTFPQATWEARIYQHLLKASGRSQDVQSIVYGMLPLSESPFGEAIGVCLGGLKQRDLVGVAEEKKLKVISVKHWDLPEATVQLVGRQPLQAVVDLAQRTERERPELWKLLLDQVQRGIKRNEKSSDSGPDFSND